MAGRLLPEWKIVCYQANNHIYVIFMSDFITLNWLRGPDLNRRPSGYEPDGVTVQTAKVIEMTRLVNFLKLYAF